MEVPQGVGGGAVIGVFNGNAGAAEGVSFAVFDGTRDRCLGGKPACQEEEGGEEGWCLHDESIIFIGVMQSDLRQSVVPCFSSVVPFASLGNLVHFLSS